MDAKDYHVKVTVRNGRIVSRMAAAGIDSVAELARRAQCSYVQAVQIVAMKQLPLDRKGSWRDIVSRIAGILQCDEDELFNEQQKTTPLSINTGETFMDFDQVARICSSGGIEQSEAALTAEKLLTLLSPRERFVVETISAGGTGDEAGRFTEIGEKWDVSTTRAMQIYRKAIRTMRRHADPRRNLKMIGA